MNAKYPVAHIELLDITAKERADLIAALAEFRPEEQANGTIVLIAGLSQNELQQRLDQHLVPPARARILLQRNFGESE